MHIVRSKRLVQLWVVILAGITLSAVAFPTLGQDAPKIRLGLQPWLGYGPWWIAEQNGYFEERGVDVEVINFTWDQDMGVALASGRLDVQTAATNTLISLLNQDIDIQAFMILDASYEADAIVAPASITSVEELAGKKVAYELGSTSDLLLNYALGQAGLTIEDIEAVPMAAADAGAALVAGRVDIAVTYEPYISAALMDTDEFAKLYTSAEKPGLISDVMIAQRDFIEANAEAIQALALAWDDAVTFLRENPEEGGQIIADAVGIPLEEFQVAFEGVQVYNLEENAELLAGDFQDAYLEIGEIWMALNPDVIAMIPDPEEVILTDFVPMAAE